MWIRTAVKGLLTFVPGMQRVLTARGTGGSNSASYCYGVWLKHLTLLWEKGMRSIPRTFAELGPGDSLGVGLAAMLCGVNRYYALDVVKHSNTEINLNIFNELVELLKARAPRPTKGWPDFDQYLDSSCFPSHILNDQILKEALSKKRIEAIRDAILGKPDDHAHELTIKYMVPWSDDNIIERNSVDLILSHSVLEHVVDIEKTYQALHAWLRPKGMMSHQIDFESHGISRKWNGYRAYSELLWKAMMGKRSFLINRQPHSVHLDIMKKNGFIIASDFMRYRRDGIHRSELSSHWQNITDDDLTCSGTFIVAIKLQAREYNVAIPAHVS
jgi:methyltransferase family protein